MDKKSVILAELNHYNMLITQTVSSCPLPLIFYTYILLIFIRFNNPMKQDGKLISETMCVVRPNKTQRKRIR